MLNRLTHNFAAWALGTATGTSNDNLTTGNVLNPPTSWIKRIITLKMYPPKKLGNLFDMGLSRIVAAVDDAGMGPMTRRERFRCIQAWHHSFKKYNYLQDWFQLTSMGRSNTAKMQP